MAASRAVPGTEGLIFISKNKKRKEKDLNPWIHGFWRNYKMGRSGGLGFGGKYGIFYFSNHNLTDAGSRPWGGSCGVGCH